MLLAHPERGAEGRVLLDHFGLTARDVLPASYPIVRPDVLQRRADAIDYGDQPAVSEDVERIVEAAQGDAPRAGLEISGLLDGFLKTTNEVARQLHERLGATGVDGAQLASAYGGLLADSGNGALSEQ